MSTEQVTDLIDKYNNKEMKAKEVMAYIGVGRTRFYQLVAVFEEQGSNFSIEYERTKSSRWLSADIEKDIKRELIEEKKLIENKHIPTKRYNYSFVRTYAQTSTTGISFNHHSSC